MRLMRLMKKMSSGHDKLSCTVQVSTMPMMYFINFDDVFQNPLLKTSQDQFSTGPGVQPTLLLN